MAYEFVSGVFRQTLYCQMVDATVRLVNYSKGFLSESLYINRRFRRTDAEKFNSLCMFFDRERVELEQRSEITNWHSTTTYINGVEKAFVVPAPRSDDTSFYKITYTPTNTIVYIRPVWEGTRLIAFDFSLYIDSLLDKDNEWCYYNVYFWTRSTTEVEQTQNKLKEITGKIVQFYLEKAFQNKPTFIRNVFLPTPNGATYGEWTPSQEVFTLNSFVSTSGWRQLKRVVAKRTAADADRAFSVLLYGPSGCGKTGSVTLLARDHKKPLMVLNVLATNDDNVCERFNSAWAQLQPNSIVLLDDLDRIFEVGRKNGAIINVLLTSLSQLPSGCWLFLTTNRRHVLHRIPSFLSPHRFGDHIEFGRFEEEDLANVIQWLTEKFNLAVLDAEKRDHIAHCWRVFPRIGFWMSAIDGCETVDELLTKIENYEEFNQTINNEKREKFWHIVCWRQIQALFETLFIVTSLGLGHFFQKQ